MASGQPGANLRLCGRLALQLWWALDNLAGSALVSAGWGGEWPPCALILASKCPGSAVGTHPTWLSSASPQLALPAVADPFLLRRGDKLYMFYETKSTEQQKGQIGVAVSSDGGMSFQHQAVVLDLPWHLSYPFVFEHNGQVRQHHTESQGLRPRTCASGTETADGAAWQRSLPGKGSWLPSSRMHSAFDDV